MGIGQGVGTLRYVDLKNNPQNGVGTVGKILKWTPKHRISHLLSIR